MTNFVALGWKRDLVHFIGCCWEAQVGPLEDEGWRVAIEKFISVMVKWKKEWIDVKELTPLKYMPYVARTFREVTGKDLQGLDRFTARDPADQPSSSMGAGDNTWASWHKRVMQEYGGRISESQGPPFPITSAQVRRESVGQIYGRVHGKNPPNSNIVSKALRAYYTRVNLLTLHTWASEVLCMIAEYHMACVTRGSPVTSPILPGELEEHLPSLAIYAPPEDRTGSTDHWDQTLRVAVWCHRLDMVVSDPDSSKFLVRSRHWMGSLLAYFLGPGTAWRLTFEDVVTQVLQENRQLLDTKRDKAAASLHNCSQRRATLHREIDATTVALEMTTNTPNGRETDVRLTTLRTALGAIEEAMTTYEDLLEDCRMQEEACQEEAPPEDPEDESSDTEMANDEDDLREEAEVEVPPPPLEDAGPAPGGDVVSPEEDALLMQPALQPEGPVAGSHSPRSEAGMVLGEMAGLSITSPSQPELAEDETPP